MIIITLIKNNTTIVMQADASDTVSIRHHLGESRVPLQEATRRVREYLARGWIEV